MRNVPLGLGLDRRADPDEAAAVAEVALERLLLPGVEQVARRVEEHDGAEAAELMVDEPGWLIGRLDGEVVVLAELLDGLEPGLGRGGPLLRTAPEDQDPVVGRRRRGDAGWEQGYGDGKRAGEHEESAWRLTHGVLQGGVPATWAPRLHATRNMLVVRVEGFSHVS